MSWLFAVLCLLGLAACNRDPRAFGDSCTRSSECSKGLVCIDLACSDDLRALGDRGGTVPMLTPEEVVPAENADAGDAMTSPPAADAAAVPDAQAPDAGP